MDFSFLHSLLSSHIVPKKKIVNNRNRKTKKTSFLKNLTTVKSPVVVGAVDDKG